ncbi:trigger factor [Butyrivibrio sp. AE2032]|uniref:trigger factor n=1 Tax=Butyrivibrio sp. AE2032 TaxID=1458463 RepID=UPI000554FB5B|nr:trigger factor [Butyrivibrio sp. AE2032]
MASTIEKKEHSQVVISFEASKEEWNEALKKSYSKNKGRFQVPGFRKGKVPYQLVCQYYGEGVLYEDAMNEIANAQYPEAVKEHDLKVVSRPEMDVTDISEEGIKYTVTVYVKPEFELGQYEGVEVPFKDQVVTDEDVDAEIERLRKRNASLEEVEDRAAAEGDTVVIDYEGFKDGVAFEGGKGEGYNLKLGSKSFIPGFEEQVAGHNVGENFTIEVKFPEDYHAAELKGADATFNVTIHAIKTEVIPELDDEFAKDVSEFDTLDELKADIRAKQQERADKDNKAGFENETVRAVCDNCEIDIPESMIQNEVEQMAEDQAARMSNQGIALDMYLQYVGQSMDDFKKSLEPMARVRVKSSLVIEKITEVIDPEVTAEDYEEELKGIADRYKIDVEEVKKSIGEDSAFIKDSIRARKTVEYLASKAVKVEPKEPEAAEAAEEASEEAPAEEKTEE